MPQVTFWDRLMFNRQMTDWSQLLDVRGWPAIWIPDVLERLERQPEPRLWQELADDLVRSGRDALATLHQVAARSLPGRTDADFRDRLQATLAFAGYTFWAVISLDYSDEHYRMSCPHCVLHVHIVIGEHGHYSAIRTWHDGDVRRIPLRRADPATLTGIASWMHDTAAANGELSLANGLTYLFGDATCPHCGRFFAVAARYEAENSAPQPIEPLVPR